MTSEIIIVSGLPRSGTSLAMQMLAAGGVEVLSDGERAADEDNPRGYLELEQVKKIKQDVSWLPAARGKAVKMISQLVYDLPANELYRVLVMRRSLDEILASQEKMLARLGRPALPRERMRQAFAHELERFQTWLGLQSHMTALWIDYAELMARPPEVADQIAKFVELAVERKLEAGKMIAAVDPALYRSRNQA